MELTENYGLVLPKNYVSINETEMEYVDGGMSYDISNVGLVQVFFDKTESGDIAALAGLTSFIAVYIGSKLGPTVPGVVCDLVAIASAYLTFKFWVGSNHDGVEVSAYIWDIPGSVKVNALGVWWA